MSKTDAKGRTVHGALIFHTKKGDKLIPLSLRTIPDILITIGRYTIIEDCFLTLCTALHHVMLQFLRRLG
jgi:hypothetical protein